MNTFYTEDKLKTLGLKAYGKNVLIGRHAILYNPEKLSLGHDVRIDDFTIISGKVTLHNYIHISHFCGLYGGDEGIEMMDFSGLSSKVNIYAVSDDYSGASMTNPMIPAEYKPTMISKGVLIEKHGIIGNNTSILPGVTIAEGSCLGSMSLCTKSTEPWSVYVGIPAKKQKDRKKDILELEKKFKESEAYYE